MYEAEKHLDAIAREIEDLKKAACECSREGIDTGISSADWHLFSIAKEIMVMRFMIEKLAKENMQLHETLQERSRMPGFKRKDSGKENRTKFSCKTGPELPHPLQIVTGTEG